MKPEDFMERWNKWRQYRSLKKYRQHLDDEARKPRQPMPTIRRTLTLPLHPSDNGGSQMGSLLWDRLTFDTRHQIYREILGGQCFHIIRKFSRLCFLFCQARETGNHTQNGCLFCQAMDTGNHSQNGCWGYEEDDAFIMRYWSGPMPNEHWPWYNGDWRVTYTTDGGLLPLLLTCRAIYSEAISVLYSANLFAFCNPSTFELFCSLVPSQRLANIRKLHIELMGGMGMMYIASLTTPAPELFQEKTEWIQFWTLVGQLKGLKSLEVKVVAPPPFWRFSHGPKSLPTATTGDTIETQDDLLDPLRSIRTPDRFDIILPEECRENMKADDRFHLRFFTLGPIRGLD